MQTDMAVDPGAGPSHGVENFREIGQLASWSVSSSKPGFGAEQLLDPSILTLWQSEGPQPHLINIQFPKRMAVAQLSLYTDHSVDDSYTPHRISIRAGSSFADLEEVKTVELEQPKGWQNFKLGSSTGAEADETIDPTDIDSLVVRAHLIQVAIMSNHLNGKDTHVRRIIVYAPREQPSALVTIDDDDLRPFTTETFRMHQTIR